MALPSSGLLADGRAMALPSSGLLGDGRAMALPSSGLLADSHAMALAGGESQPSSAAQLAVPPSTAPSAVRAPAPGPGDGVLEVHYVGELELGEQFPGISEDEGLFVDYEALAGQGWLPIAKQEGYVGQTQTAYADAEGVHVFNHPINLHFFSTSVAEWPQLHLQVFKLDETGRVMAVSFGSLALPCTPGHSELVCRTWTPHGASCLDEARATYMGGPPGALLAARAEVLAAKLPEARTQLVTRTSGKVRVSLDTILRNAKSHGLHLP